MFLHVSETSYLHFNPMGKGHFSKSVRYHGMGCGLLSGVNDFDCGIRRTLNPQRPYV